MTKQKQSSVARIAVHCPSSLQRRTKVKMTTVKSEECKIVIIGSGPTGLGAAWRLQELGHENFVMLDQASEPGGLARSDVDPQGFTWDYGTFPMLWLCLPVRSCSRSGLNRVRSALNTFFTSVGSVFHRWPRRFFALWLLRQGPRSRQPGLDQPQARSLGLDAR